MLYNLTNDEYMTEDILQDTFVKVYKNISKFKHKSSFFTWLYRIAINTAKTALKKKSKQKENSINESVIKIESEDNEQMEDIYMKKRINEAINKLPKKQRLIFTLRFYDQRNFNDISSILNISQNTAKVNYHHAMNKMKTLLGDLV